MVQIRITYTREQLIKLRDSLLVVKPDTLPSIDQWLDQPPHEAQRKPKPQNGRPDESGPMGNFGAQRPSLLQTRQVRNSNGEDVVLGPPKTSFASSRNIRRADDGGSAAQTPGEDNLNFDISRARTQNDDDGVRRKGFGADRDKELGTPRPGRNFEGRGENRGPTSDKERIFGRGTRERIERGPQGDDDNGKRNGYGQRSEQRWTRDADEKRPQRPAGRDGGWRERERPNERDSFRGQPQEKEPEWMEEAYVDDEPQARSVADFEKWKAKMKGQKYEAVEEKAELPPPERSPGVPRAAAPLLPDAMFGTWGETKKVESPSQQEPTPVKPTGNKKASRFASMFAPKEDIRQPEPESHITQAHSPLPTEDQQGFQNILMKLRGTGVSSQDAVPTLQNTRPPPGFNHGPAESRADRGPSPNPLLQAMLAAKSDGRPDSRSASNFSPVSALSHGPPSSSGDHHPSSQNHRQESYGSMPHRNITTPEAQNVQNLLAAQRSQRQVGLSKDSEFLLNLINAKSASRPSQPRQQEFDPNFQVFLDQPPRPHTQGAQRQHPPGPQEPPFSPHRGPEQPDRRQPNTQPPPGFFDGPHMPPNFPPQQRPPQNGPPGFGPPPGDFFNPDDPRHHLDRLGPGPNPPPGFPAHMRGPPGMLNLFHGGPPGPNGPPPPQFMQQRGPPGLPGHGHPQQPPPDLFGPGGPGVAPPPGFPTGPNYGPGAPPGFGPPPNQRGVPGLNTAGLNFGPGPHGLKSPIEQGPPPPPGIRSPIDGFGGFGRGR